MGASIVKWLSYASAALFLYFAVNVFWNGLKELL